MSDRHTWKWNETDKTTFVSCGQGELSCDSCADQSLRHDSCAYFNPNTSRLLCETCYKKEAPSEPQGYMKVVTFH